MAERHWSVVSRGAGAGKVHLVGAGPFGCVKDCHVVEAHQDACVEEDGRRGVGVGGAWALGHWDAGWEGSEAGVVEGEEGRDDLGVGHALEDPWDLVGDHVGLGAGHDSQCEDLVVGHGSHVLEAAHDHHIHCAD